MTSNGSERRRFKRLKTAVLYREVSLFAPRPVIDLSEGGIRIFSDDAVKVGRLLEIDLTLPTGQSLTCSAQVVWISELPKGAAAAYDVGLRFINLEPEDLKKLERLLEPVTEPPGPNADELH